MGGGVWGFYSLYAISHRYEHTTGIIRTLQTKKIYRYRKIRYKKEMQIAYSTDKYKEVPYLDVSSTYEPSRNEVVTNVVNRNKDKAITADILSQTGSFDKKATANIVSGANTNITNSVNEQNVDIKKEEIKTSGEKITYSFAPRSFTQIIVKVK